MFPSHQRTLVCFRSPDLDVYDLHLQSDRTGPSPLYPLWDRRRRRSRGTDLNNTLYPDDILFITFYSAPSQNSRLGRRLFKQFITSTYFSPSGRTLGLLTGPGSSGLSPRSRPHPLHQTSYRHRLPPKIRRVTHVIVRSCPVPVPDTSWTMVTGFRHTHPVLQSLHTRVDLSSQTRTHGRSPLSVLRKRRSRVSGSDVRSFTGERLVRPSQKFKS